MSGESRKRPDRRVVARRRRQRHRGGEREEDEGEDGFPPDERGQAMHRGPPPRAGQRGKDSRAVHDREAEDRNEDCELSEQQAAVGRPRQGGDALDLHERIHHARGHQQEHRDQRGPRETSRRAHGIGPCVRTGVRVRRSQQQGERHEGADPDTGAEKVRGVDGHGQRRARGDGRRVTGAAHERQRQRGQGERLATCDDPVPAFGNVRPHREKRPEHDEEAVARQPHQSRPRVEDRVPHGAGLERRLRPVLEARRPQEQPDDSRADHHEHQKT